MSSFSQEDLQVKHSPLIWVLFTTFLIHVGFGYGFPSSVTHLHSQKASVVKANQHKKQIIIDLFVWVNLLETTVPLVLTIGPWPSIVHIQQLRCSFLQ